MVCPPVRKIIHSLKLVEYLQVQAGNQWYNYYVKDKPIYAKGNISWVKVLRIIPEFRILNAELWG